MADLPTGTITFLFTDIEGSTKLWQEHPALMPEALTRHHSILNECIAAHGGYVFQIIGDAFCAAFSIAINGLCAALSAQRALCDEPWGETGPLRVRMALHTGTAEVRAGEYTTGEYASGLTLSRAARFLSAGHGGQVLLSDATRALVEDDLPESLWLRDLGQHRLKDLRRAEPIYQLVIPTLPCDFPPLKTLDARPNNLPIQLTTFIGREQELAEVKQLLTEGRLVTITGAGGTGKTRLALQVGAELADGFADGVWIVELAPVVDPDLVPNTVAAALGVHDDPGRPLLLALQDALRRKDLLLVLDNCEHLLEASARLADTLLHAAPGLKILVTSREGLGIAGESCFRIPSLLLPPTGERPTVEGLTLYESVRLFIDRALAAQPNFQVTNANAPAVAQICHHLDGIPLAIELAATRVVGLSVEQIAQRLDDRFRLLTGGSRTALPRHRTLYASIDWSHDLLAEDERVLFRRLAVFAGGFRMEAAESICSDETLDWRDIADLLLRLVEKSLVVASEHGTEMRYYYLETIRAYARERLAESSEEPAIRRRHLAFFQHLAKEASPKVRSSEARIWLDRLTLEWDNMRTAMNWAIREEPEAAVEFAWHLFNYIQVHHGFGPEERDWMSQILAKTEGMPPSVTRFRALALAGSAAGRVVDYMRKISLLDQALEMGRTYASKADLAFTLLRRGAASQYAGDPEARRRYHEASLKLYEELDDPSGMGWCLMRLANAALARGELDSAEALFRASMEKLQQSGDRWMISNVLNNWGELARLRGDYATAIERYQAALNIESELSDKPRNDTARANWGWVALRSGNLPLARELFVQAIGICRDVGNTVDLANGLAGLAGVIGLQGDPQRAAQLFGAEDAARPATGNPWEPADRIDYEHILAAVRAKMGERAFDSAFAEGRAMTLEQALDRALDESHRMKPPEDLHRQADTERYGGLTPREREVAILIAQGKSNPEIAEALVVSERTVTTHVTHILTKLGFTSRTQVASWATAQQLTQV